MPTRRKLEWLCAVLVAIGVVVVFSGTLVESHWTGSMEPCERVTTSDNSTWQVGHSSMRWLPPQIHCEFPRTLSDDVAEQRPLPAVSTNQFAVFGIALTGFIAGSILFVAALVSWLVRRSHAKQRVTLPG